MTEIMRDVQIESDGKTVWINDSGGCCIGRFSKTGIDIHHDGETQMKAGQQCLQCEKGPTDLAAWHRFVTGMHRHFGVTVSPAHMPNFLKEFV